MRIGIGKVTKELGIKPHVLHTYEQRGWLGYEPILKDPAANNQRVYSEEQLERIRFIHGLIEDQRKNGNKRTDLDVVHEALLERFGGEIVPIKEETSLLPSTVDEFQHLLLQNNKMLADIMEQSKKQDEKMQALLVQQQKEKAEMQSELQLIKDKLDLAVAYIQKQEQEEQQEKKGFWKKLLG